VDALDANACNLVGESEVSMSGKAAAFGARMIGPVSDQVLGQFAANFAARLQAAPPPGDAPLNALSLMWAIVKGWFRSLFARQ
jgi:hypothetical protein